MKLQIIIGSIRQGRSGLPVANWFYERAKMNGKFEVELIDLKEVNLPLMDEPNLPSRLNYTEQTTKDWSERINQGDAYVFIMPEYNYAIPAPLKNAFDYLYHEWMYKPLGFVSYGEVTGGRASQQMMRGIATVVNMMPILEETNIPFVHDYIDNNGVFNSIEKFDAKAEKMLDKLFLCAKHLKALREEIKKIKNG